MSKRILVVEDQPDNRQIIRDMLAPTDYEITEAENGEQALTAIAKQRPDLILMDIQLPIMDGYEATRRIKADASLRSIPIIAVTSYALSGEGQKARAAGCDDYVPNPTAGEDSAIPAIAAGTFPETDIRSRPAQVRPNVIFFHLPGLTLGTGKPHGAAGIHHTSWWRCHRLAACRARAAI